MVHPVEVPDNLQLIPSMKAPALALSPALSICTRSRKNESWGKPFAFFCLRTFLSAKLVCYLDCLTNIFNASKTMRQLVADWAVEMYKNFPAQTVQNALMTSRFEWF